MKIQRRIAANPKGRFRILSKLYETAYTANTDIFIIFIMSKA